MTTKDYRIAVENFSLYDGETSLHFERDMDLYVEAGRALSHPAGAPKGRQAALVLIELGIDGEHAHRVRVDQTSYLFCPGPGEDPSLYDGAFVYPHQNPETFILSDALEAVEALLERLRAMNATEQAPAAPVDGRCRCGLLADALVHNATANGHDFAPEVATR